MAKIITLLLICCCFVSHAQFNQNITTVPRTDIVKFDFSTYNGTPIKKGWLFTEDAYKKLYVSYNAADSLIKAFDQYETMIQQMDTLHKQVVANYEKRIVDKDLLIKKQNDDFNRLDGLLKDSDKNVKKFEKQFIKIAGVYIHIGTAVKVGVSGLVVGWLVGSAMHH